MDGCSSHISNEISTLGIENDIDVMLLPANLTHLMQPLDLCVFSALKRFFKEEIKNHNLNKIGSNIPRSQICKLIRDPYLKALSPLNIMKSFEVSGIHPINANKILSNPALCPCDVTSTRASSSITEASNQNNSKTITQRDTINISETATIQSKNLNELSRDDLIRKVADQHEQIQILNEKAQSILIRQHQHPKVHFW